MNRTKHVLQFGLYCSQLAHAQTSSAYNFCCQFVLLYISSVIIISHNYLKLKGVKSEEELQAFTEINGTTTKNDVVS